MRYLLFLAGAYVLSAQPSITLHPSVITDCDSTGLGAAAVEWSNPGGGQVKVLVAEARVPFTALAPPSGSAVTGLWVNDGMPFVLVDSAGNMLASTTAHVVCSPGGGPVAAGLSSASYMPLDIGNRWIYATKSRFGPTSYAQWLVTGFQEVNGQLWFVIQITSSGQQTTGGQMLLRPGDNGRIYILQNGQERLWLDPNVPQDPSALMQITSRGPFQNPLGNFADSISYVNMQALEREDGIMVRGIGLVSNNSTMLTGSSGGFLSSLDLVEALIDGHLVFQLPSASIQVSSEATSFDVSDGLVTNCILPCYFAACGLGGPSPDPAGTYKPCFRAGAKLTGVSGTVPVDLDILDASGAALAHTSMTLVADDSGRSEGFEQLPLYTAPNQPFPPGTYQLRATSGTSSAMLPFEIR